MTCDHQFSDLYCLKCGAFQPSVLMGRAAKGKPKTLSKAGLKQRQDAAKKKRPRKVLGIKEAKELHPSRTG